MTAVTPSNASWASIAKRDVVLVSQARGEPVTVQVRGGTLVVANAPLKEVANHLGCHFFGSQPGRDFAFSADNVVGRSQQGSQLRIDLPDGVFLMIDDTNPETYDYAVKASAAQRTGQPMPVPPAGIIVKPE